MIRYNQDPASLSKGVTWYPYKETSVSRVVVTAMKLDYNVERCLLEIQTSKALKVYTF